MVSAFIFDLDGTLFDCGPMSVYTFRRALQELEAKHGVKLPDYSDKYIRENLGLPGDEISRRMIPKEHDALRKEYFKYVGAFEAEYMEAGKASLFPGIPELLETIKEKGGKIFLASNCVVWYMEYILKRFDIWKYFDGPYCIGMFPEATHKSEVVANLIKDHNLDPNKTIMIGDRWNDIQAGRRNGTKTVGCLYGIGLEDEFEDADYKVGSVPELKRLLLNLI